MLTRNGFTTMLSRVNGSYELSRMAIGFSLSDDMMRAESIIEDLASPGDGGFQEVMEIMRSLDLASQLCVTRKMIEHETEVGILSRFKLSVPDDRGVRHLVGGYDGGGAIASTIGKGAPGTDRQRQVLGSVAKLANQIAAIVMKSEEPIGREREVAELTRYLERVGGMQAIPEARVAALQLLRHEYACCEHIPEYLEHKQAARAKTLPILQADLSEKVDALWAIYRIKIQEATPAGAGLREKVSIKLKLREGVRTGHFAGAIPEPEIVEADSEEVADKVQADAEVPGASDKGAAISDPLHSDATAKPLFDSLPIPPKERRAVVHIAPTVPAAEDVHTDSVLPAQPVIIPEQMDLMFG